MMTHTKGPWKATRNQSFSYSIGTDYVHDRGHDCNVVREVRCEANALLIAAAPELLESLELVLGELKQRVAETGVERHIFEIKKAEAAIRKAKGGSE